MRRRRLILGLGGAVAAAGYMLAFGARQSRKASPLPMALTDMDWALTDQRGRTVSPADWEGRPAMVFFGFTFCPDVCPTTLIDISGWLEALGPDADRLAVSLITVDPERDTPAALADYLSNFDARIIGLTGSPDQIVRAAAAFRVRYEKLPTDGGDYTMNHTAGVFLFRPDGSFASIIDFHEDRRFALPKLRRILA